MAKIVIQDLDENAELDHEAMRQVIGGRASTGSALFGNRPRSLVDLGSKEGDAVLPRIGLTDGSLGGKDVL